MPEDRAWCWCFGSGALALVALPLATHGGALVVAVLGCGAFELFAVGAHDRGELSRRHGDALEMLVPASADDAPAGFEEHGLHFGADDGRFDGAEEHELGAWSPAHLAEDAEA